MPPLGGRLGPPRRPERPPDGDRRAVLPSARRLLVRRRHAAGRRGVRERPAAEHASRDRPPALAEPLRRAPGGDRRAARRRLRTLARGARRLGLRRRLGRRVDRPARGRGPPRRGRWAEAEAGAPARRPPLGRASPGYSRAPRAARPPPDAGGQLPLGAAAPRDHRAHGLQARRDPRLTAVQAGAARTGSRSAGRPARTVRSAAPLPAAAAPASSAPPTPIAVAEPARTPSIATSTPATNSAASASQSRAG